MTPIKRDPRLLLVEDRRQDIRQVKRALAKLGYAHLPLDVVEDGASAMDFLLQRRGYEEAQRPDLIILDWMLPLKNGAEVLSEIRASQTLLRIPVVVFTTSPNDLDIEMAYGKGVNAYLRKPIDPDEFDNTVRAMGLFWFDNAYLPKS